MDRFENPLYSTTVRRVSALFGTFGIGVVGVITTLFLIHRPSGSAAFQGYAFLALGAFALAMIPVLLATARNSAPVLIGVEEDRIVGWKSGQRDGSPQLVIRFEDVRVLADYRAQSFPLLPTPTIVSRRGEPGMLPIRRLVVDGIDSPEAFTLTAENFDRFMAALGAWISKHPGSKVEQGRFTPESLRKRLGLSDPPTFR